MGCDVDFFVSGVILCVHVLSSTTIRRKNGTPSAWYCIKDARHIPILWLYFVRQVPQYPARTCLSVPQFLVHDIPHTTSGDYQFFWNFYHMNVTIGCIRPSTHHTLLSVVDMVALTFAGLTHLFFLFGIYSTETTPDFLKLHFERKLPLVEDEGFH